MPLLFSPFYLTDFTSALSPWFSTQNSEPLHCPLPPSKWGSQFPFLRLKWNVVDSSYFAFQIYTNKFTSWLNCDSSGTHQQLGQQESQCLHDSWDKKHYRSAGFPSSVVRHMRAPEDSCWKQTMLCLNCTKKSQKMVPKDFFWKPKRSIPPSIFQL